MFTYPITFYRAHPDWFTASDPSLTGNRNGYGSYTFRIVVGAAEFSKSGSKIRVSFESSGGAGIVVTDAFVGHAGAGDAYDFDGAQVELLFSAGSGFTIGTSETILSDEIDFAFDSSKNLVVSFYITASSADDPAAETTLTNYTGYQKVADDAGTTDATGYAASLDCVGVTKIEVFG